jgi:hypothetical protein
MESGHGKDRARRRTPLDRLELPNEWKPAIRDAVFATFVTFCERFLPLRLPPDFAKPRNEPAQKAAKIAKESHRTGGWSLVTAKIVHAAARPWIASNYPTNGNRRFGMRSLRPS